MNADLAGIFLQAQPTVHEKIDALRGDAPARDLTDAAVEIAGFVVLLAVIAIVYLVLSRRAAREDAKARGAASYTAPQGVVAGLDGVDSPMPVWLFWNADGLRRQAPAVLRRREGRELELGDLDAGPPPIGPARMIGRDLAGRVRIQDVAIRSASRSGRVAAEVQASSGLLPSASLRIDAGLPAHLTEGTGSTRRRARILDLTHGGAGLVLERKLDVDATIRLEIETVERAQATVARARVAWCQEAGDGLWRAGVAFETSELGFAASLFDILCEMGPITPTLRAAETPLPTP